MTFSREVPLQGPRDAALIRNYAAFIWQVADPLRGLYKQPRTARDPSSHGHPALEFYLRKVYERLHAKF